MASLKDFGKRCQCVKGTAAQRVDGNATSLQKESSVRKSVLRRVGWFAINSRLCIVRSNPLHPLRLKAQSALVVVAFHQKKKKQSATHIIIIFSAHPSTESSPKKHCTALVCRLLLLHRRFFRSKTSLNSLLGSLLGGTNFLTKKLKRSFQTFGDQTRKQSRPCSSLRSSLPWYHPPGL